MAAVLGAPLAPWVCDGVHGDDAPVLVAESRILLRRGVGVGLVLASLSQLRVPAPVRTPAPVDGEEGDTTAFVEGMKKRWSSLFEVSDLGDGVTVVSLGADRCRQALAIKMKDETFSGSPVEVLFEVAARLDSSLKPGGHRGVAVSGPPGVEELIKTEVLMQPISIRTRGSTLFEVLNRLVRAAPTVGWIAAERCESGQPCRCELGLFSPRALATPGYDASASLPVDQP
jgi:hypothetical protein